VGAHARERRGPDAGHREEVLDPAERPRGGDRPRARRPDARERLEHRGRRPVGVERKAPEQALRAPRRLCGGPRPAGRKRKRGSQQQQRGGRRRPRPLVRAVRLAHGGTAGPGARGF
jgi:hypothetical protein